MHGLIALHYLTEDERVPIFYQIGWERWLPEDQYDRDCQTGTDPHCIFAYTVSGRGEIAVDGEWFNLTPGHAFFVEVPGPFRYRLPESADHWELKFLSITLDCLPVWTTIVQKAGRIIRLRAGNGVMTTFDEIYRLAQQDMIVDMYHNSSYLYQFLMTLKRFLSSSRSLHDVPASIQICQNRMEINPEKQWSLDDYAQLAGISKYHLTRLFQEYLGESPMHYLSKTRVKRAAQLLIHTDHGIRHIARATGFSNPNYFSKVFRKWMNLTPSEFRDYAKKQQVSHIQLK